MLKLKSTSFLHYFTLRLSNYYSSRERYVIHFHFEKKSTSYFWIVTVEDRRRHINEQYEFS